VSSCAVSPDGSRILTASGDTLRLWELLAGRLLATLTGHTRDINDCTFSPDGKLIASASSDGSLKLWSAANGAKVCELVLGSEIHEIDWSPEGCRVVVGTSTGEIHLLRLENVSTRAPVVTPWKPREGRYAGGFGCPICRGWSEVPAFCFGKELDCPRCGGRIRLNWFWIDSDWHAIEHAWGGG